MVTLCFSCLHEFDTEHRLMICPHVPLIGHKITELKQITPEQMIVELEKAGWTKKFAHVWASPGGALFYGPVQAFRVMRGGPRWAPQGSMSIANGS